MTLPGIIIVGAGGLGREIASWLESAGAGDRIAGFLDDTRPAGANLSASFPYPVLGPVGDYVPEVGHELIVAVGAPRDKLRIAHGLAERGARFHTMIHPTAQVARTATLGKGVIMFPYTIVSADAVLGDFVTINSFGGIGHDGMVGSGTTLSAHVDVTGHVRLGEGVFIGSNATILPGVEVGAFAVVGAGAVVMRKVDAGSTVYAPPARKL